jgi:hypothetical protein
VETPAIPITQKLLAGAGGWPAMKLAKQLQEAGRVTDVSYTPPLLSGMVREGNRNLRSGLRIKTESDIENLCTCREAREWGKICAHALAVGLQHLAPAAAPPPPAPKPIAASVRSGPTFVEAGATTGDATRAPFHPAAKLRRRLGETSDHARGGSRAARQARDSDRLVA